MIERTKTKDEAVDIDRKDEKIYNAYLKIQYLSDHVSYAGFDSLAMDMRLIDIRDYYLWETLDSLGGKEKAGELMRRFSHMADLCHSPDFTPPEYLDDPIGLTTVGFISGYFFALNQLLMLHHQIVIPSHAAVGISKKGLSRKDFEKSWVESKRYLSDRFLDHLMKRIDRRDGIMDVIKNGR